MYAYFVFIYALLVKFYLSAEIQENIKFKLGFNIFIVQQICNFMFELVLLFFTEGSRS